MTTIGPYIIGVVDTHRWCSDRMLYPENGCEVMVPESTACVCDTDLCNDAVTAPQSPPIECYEDYGCEEQANPDRTCTGEVCIKITGVFMIYTVKLSSTYNTKKRDTMTAMCWCYTSFTTHDKLFLN